jgi:hypothetical protein
LFFRAFCLDHDEATRVPHPVGLAYQPSAVFFSHNKSAISNQQAVLSAEFLIETGGVGGGRVC